MCRFTGQLIKTKNQQKIMTKFFHIGVIVDDLNQAIQYYQDTQGLRFAEPATKTFNVTNPQTGDSEVVDLTVTYSRSGPPYLELIQAVGDGLFSISNGQQIWYYGLWDRDINQSIAKLKQANQLIDGIISSESEPEAIITAPDAYGVRYEYVPIQLQGIIKAWTFTGKVPDNNKWSAFLTVIFSIYYTIKNIFSSP